jgi:hypothetical protein
MNLIFERNRGALNNNYTGQESNCLLGMEGCHPKASGKEMTGQVNNKSGQNTETSQLSKQDVRLLVIMCADLVNLCAKLTGRVDPAAAAMLTYVRDDIVSTNRDEPH